MIDTHEPLFGGEENQRILAAPAMRIAVRELERMEQRAGRTQFLDDRVVGLENILAYPLAAVGGELAGRVDRRKRLEPVLRADHEIFVAMSGRGMHEAGAGVGRNMVAVHQLYIAGNERMAENILPVERLERFAIERDTFFDRERALLLDRLGQPRGDDVIALARLERDVIE